MWGLGRDRVMEPVRIVFNTSFQHIYQLFFIPYDWSIVTVYLFDTYINYYLASQSTESNKHVEHVKPPTMVPLDILQF